MFIDRTRPATLAQIDKRWRVVDASNQVVGRLASVVSRYLLGKHKPSYTPHIVSGDSVVVVNAGQVRFTGKKMKDKVYLSYTGYPGGQRATTPQRLKENHPHRILEHAIKGMLPKNRLGRALFRNLFVYVGPSHPHSAQCPEPIAL
jgi:large subunit ribosomal protein L13